MNDWAPISAGKLKWARRLQTAKGREVAGELLAEGPQAVREALDWGRVRHVIVAADATLAAVELAGAAEAAGRPVFLADAQEMAAITDTVHGQGIVAVAELPVASLDQVVAPRLVLILDEVRDPGNVGTMIRAADAFGADAVVLTTGCAEPWAPKSVRASVGSVWHLSVVTGVTFDSVAAWAKSAGLALLATATGGTPLQQLGGALAGPVAWVVGNEAAGLPPKHLGVANQTVAVPMWGKAESLNVASAAAVCLYATAVAQRAT